MWPIERTSEENFRKVYKSRNLPRSGLLEPIRIETTFEVVSIRCSRSPERQADIYIIYKGIGFVDQLEGEAGNHESSSLNKGKSKLRRRFLLRLSDSPGQKSYRWGRFISSFSGPGRTSARPPDWERAGGER